MAFLDPICGANIRLRAVIRDDLATPISDISALISRVSRIRSTCSSNRNSRRRICCDWPLCLSTNDTLYDLGGSSSIAVRICLENLSRDPNPCDCLA